MPKSAIPALIDRRPMYLAPDETVTQSSVGAGWSEEVAVEGWSLPAMAWPEHTIARSRLVVHVGSRPVTAAWTEDGRMRQTVLLPGAIQIVPQGAVTRANWSTVLEVVALEFSSSLLGRLLEGHGAAPSEALILRRNVCDPAAYHLSQRVVRELAVPTEPLYGESLCLALAIHLLERYGRSAARAFRVKGRLSSGQSDRVLEYIRANLDGPLSVAALAGVVGLSDAHFARAFRATFREPPHRLVLRWRIERARRLVAVHGLTPAEAATSCGFCDQAHLTHAMRRHFGTTPGRLAAAPRDHAPSRR